MFEVNSANELALLELRTLKRSLTFDYKVFSTTYRKYLLQDGEETKLIDMQFVCKTDIKFTYQLSLNMELLKSKLASSELFNSNAILFKETLPSSDLCFIPSSGFETVLLDIRGNITKEKFYLN